MTFLRHLTRAVALCALFVTTVQAAKRPNVVVIFTDDQGTLDAGCYGSDDLHTPNIDRLASRGVRFTQAYAHTVCCPARAALMTGRHPQRSGVNSWCQGDMNEPDGINMALEEITLAETMKGAGYQTALFGKWHLGAHRDFGPKKQGFDEFFGIRDGFIDNFNHYFLHGKGFHDLYEGTTEVWAADKFFPELITDRALAFMETNRARPFFLYLALNTPHYPEQAPPEHLALYPNMPEPRRSYAAFVTTTDHYIGKVLDKLDALELRENTVVIFMSDNGHSAELAHIRVDNHKSGYPRDHEYGANGGGGNTGPWIGHKGTLFEGGLRVPAIISLPGVIPQNITRSQAVTVMDWYPTVMDICNIEGPRDRLDGRSLTAVIKSAEAPSPHETLYFQWQNNWVVRQGDWKLFGKGDHKTEPKVLALRSLSGNQPEQMNLFLENRREAARLKKLYIRWAADVFAVKVPGDKQ